MRFPWQILCFILLCLLQRLAADEIAIGCGEAAIYGTVQGITEFLPVSSSAHLLLAGEILRSGGRNNLGKQAAWCFNLLLQFASALAVVAIYFGSVAKMLLGLVGRSREGLRLAVLLCVAFLPGAICGVIVDALHLAEINSIATLGWPLTIGGVYLAIFAGYWTRRANVKKLSDLTAAESLFIGAMQAIALIPGVSRSLMSISACLLVGLEPAAAMEFGFLLGAGTIFAAAVYKFQSGAMVAVVSVPPRCLLCGIGVAFIFAFPAIKILRRLLISELLTPIAYYRIILGLLIISKFRLQLT
jgi:undecaprenyl-diphosphatase